MQFKKLRSPETLLIDRLGLISTIPRSSTWATRYALAALDALLDGQESADPFSDFSPRPGLNLEMLLIGHFYHPNFDDLVDEPFKEKWMKLFDPLPGTNWMSAEIMRLRAARPNLFLGTLPTVFVYREPFSMLQSYFNQVLKSDFFVEHPLRDANGEIWRPRSYADFVINGGIQSYVKYKATFEYVARKLPSAVLFVRYEEILAERFSCFRRIVDFLGCDWVSDSKIKSALDLTDSRSLKVLETASRRTLSDSDGITAFFEAAMTYDPPTTLKSHFTGAKENSREMLSKGEIEFCEQLLTEFSDF